MEVYVVSDAGFCTVIYDDLMAALADARQALDVEAEQITCLSLLVPDLQR